MITQAQVRELFSYDPETGALTWKVRGTRGIKAGDVAGTKDSGRYVHVGIKGRMYRAHRVIWLHVHGVLPPVLDHINGNPNDNRLVNLRVASYSQNMHNQKLSSRNTSGFKGVSWCRQRCKWTANIQSRGRRKNLGYYDTPREAAVVYVLEGLELHGAFFNPGEHIAKAA